jgi:formylglycine-generating enzyme required for sulfatase activity
MAGLVTRETMRLTNGRQRPYQNGSIVSELHYSLSNAARRPEGVAQAVAAVSNPAPPVQNPDRGLPAVPPPAMVSINGGTFTMGSPGMELDRAPFGEIRRQVELNAFYLADKTVSVAEFRRFIADSGYTTTAEAEGGAFAYDEAKGEWDFRAGANWRNPGFRQGDDHPVVAVSWFDAVHYCNWLSAKEGFKPAYVISGTNVSWDRSADGYRLPTEAEWEYACRAGTETPFSAGERLSTAQANYNGNFPYSFGNRGLFRMATMPVGSFSPNNWGIYNMHGNIWEWCWDFYGIPAEAPAVNPAGPDSGAHRVNRGGDWSTAAKWLRSAARSSNFPETAGSSLGFRLARTPH